MRILQLKQAAISPPNPTTRRTERDNLGVTYGAVGFEIAGATSPEGNEALSVGLSLGDFEIRAAIPPQAADEMSVSLELDDFRFQRHPDAQASDAMEVGHLITDFSFKPHPHTQSTDAMAVSLAMTDFEYNGSASLDGLYHVGSTGPSYIESGLTISTPAIPASIEVNQAIFAVVYARSAVTPPAGWTLVDQVAAVDATAGVTQTLYIYRKDTSAPSDGGTAPLWGQSTPGRMGLAYTVVGSTTGFVSIADVAHTTTEVSTDTAYPHTVDVSTMVSESARELFLFAGNAIDGSSSDTTWGKTTGSLKTANTIPHNRLVVGALPASTAAALNTSLTYAPQLPPGKNYYGTIAIRLSEIDVVSPTKYRYWRIFITANNGDAYISIREAELRGTPGGVNLATNYEAVSASSSYSPFYPHRIFDLNLTSVWYSNGGGVPQWFKYDFGTPVSIAEIAMETNEFGRAPRDFVIQGSDDNVTWEDLKTYVGVSGWVPGTLKVFSVT